MTVRPFFTIAIPSKNRPDRLHNALRSVLQQEFSDWEVIVCDNSDESEASGTAAVVRDAADSRVRYIRTNGRLSMPDNWERAVRDARGQYVGVLTDRSVYRRDTLAIAHREIERTGAQVVCWLNDLYGRDSKGRRFVRRKRSRQSFDIESDAILHYFLCGHPKFSPKVVPKLMTGVCHRRILETVWASPLGRICPPVCPDYTSGFLMLGHSRSVVFVDDGLYVNCGVGNGLAFRHRNPLAERFLQDLGLTWLDLINRMPTEACFTHALILNDFMRVKAAFPDRYGRHALDRLQYYVGCLSEFYRIARAGIDRTDDLDALIKGLNYEPDELQRAVRSRREYSYAVLTLRVEKRRPTAIEPGEGDVDEAQGMEFDTVFDALDWAERNPRDIEAGPLELPLLSGRMVLASAPPVLQSAYTEAP